MTGSTLYRRLPDGSWAAQREDGVTPARSGGTADPAPAAAAPGAAAGIAAGVARSSARSSRAVGPQAVSSAGRQATPPRPRTTRSAPRLPRRRPRWLRVAMWAAVSYAVWLLALAVYATVSLPRADALAANPIGDTGGSVWLLVGSDSREGLTPEEQRELRTGDEQGERTDTIMLVHMGLAGVPKLISVPRDSWVTIPAHTTASGRDVPAQAGKINAAYSYGGPALLTETVEYNTGLHVDHYMEIGFNGIVRLTDAVGGIEACFDEAIQDARSGLDVPAGCQTLDGAESLAWVRMRYSDPKGDLGRVERQQQYVAAVADELLSWQTLVNPLRQWRLVNAVVGAVVVDDDAGVFTLARFGMGMGRIATGGGEVTTVPTSDADHWEAGQWVLKWDTGEANELFASIGAGTPPAQQAQ